MITVVADMKKSEHAKNVRPNKGKASIRNPPAKVPTKNPNER
ncbi:unnamed protein product, partial [Rotaria socialis]